MATEDFTLGLRDANALVMGGTGGIGFHVVAALAVGGAHVIVTGRNEDRRGRRGNGRAREGWGCRQPSPETRRASQASRQANGFVENRWDEETQPDSGHCSGAVTCS